MKSKTFKESNYLIKVTGRYQYPGISRLLTSLPQNYHIAADTRVLSRLVPYPRKYITTGLIIFSTDFYDKHVRSIYKRMCAQSRKDFVEDVLYDSFISMRYEPGIILRFPCNCEPIGIGGNGDLLNSPKKKVVAIFRAVGRILFPNYWL